MRRGRRGSALGEGQEGLWRASPLIAAIHESLLRTGRLRRAWAAAYEGVARAFGAYLRRGGDNTAYACGSTASRDLVFGLSDIDVAVIAASDPDRAGSARERVRRRYARLASSFPLLCELLLDTPLVLEDRDLADVAGQSTYSYGLEGNPPRATYSGAGSDADKLRLLEKPGLYGSARDWRRLAGRERRPPLPLPSQDPQAGRMDAWLQLQASWRWFLQISPDLERPRTAYTCVKLLSEPARILLWLMHGERVRTRAETLERALVRFPEEETALRAALDLRAALWRSPNAPVAESLGAFVRLSARVADVISAEVEREEAAEVALRWGGEEELMLAPALRRRVEGLPGASVPQPYLPLVDWRALVRPGETDEAFAPLAGDPADLNALAAAAVVGNKGPYPALRRDGFMVLASERYPRGALRVVKSPASDPVCFALAGGQAVARFPDVRGWRARDWARRAVAEHRARLGLGGGDRAASLLAAARAALFLESLERGTPELTLTAAATGGALEERRPGATEAVSDLETVVLGLGPYADGARRVRPAA